MVSKDYLNEIGNEDGRNSPKIIHIDKLEVNTPITININIDKPIEINFLSQSSRNATDSNDQEVDKVLRNFYRANS